MEEGGLTRVFLNDADAEEKAYSGRGGKVRWKDTTGMIQTEVEMEATIDTKKDVNRCFCLFCNLFESFYDI